MAAGAALKAETQDQLRGRVSAGLLLLLVVGDILGAGIYVLTGEIAAEVGGMVWLPFTMAFLIAMASAVSYAELVTRFPGAAGSALYAREAFASPVVTSMVGVAVLVSTVTTSATTARAFAGTYLSALVDAPTTTTAVVVVLVLAVIAAFGIELSARANASLTMVEVAGLILIVVIGAAALLDGSADIGAAVDRESLSTGGLMTGVALAFFAFLGFEDAVHLSEEVDDPRRVFPPVLLAAVAITGVVYLLVAVSAVIVAGAPELARSDGPLLEVVEAGPLAIPRGLFAVIALGAVTNTSLFALVAASRLLYGMARDGDLPAFLGRTTARAGSPAIAALVAGALAAVLAATGAVGPLAETAVTALLLVLLVVNIAAITTRSAPGGWRPPRWVAGVGAVATASLLLHQIVTIEAGGALRLAALLALGAAGRWLRGR